MLKKSGKELFFKNKRGLSIFKQRLGFGQKFDRPLNYRIPIPIHPPSPLNAPKE
jgi:hypothetical protein